MMRIGIDVGGTNTDAVLMKGSQIIATVKQATSADVSSGIANALRHLLAKATCDPAEIAAVMIGTTHFTNAIIEGKHLQPTAVVRLGLPATATLPPLVDWPEALATRVGHQRYMAHGGYEFDGRLISAIRPDELSDIGRKINDAGIKTIAITSVFSPLNSDIEEEAAAIIGRNAPEASITLSHQIGQIGLLERENASVLNACLRDLAAGTVAAFKEALAQENLSAPFFISQNDGTLLSAENVLRFPVLTVASGPTNSMRGAAFLSGIRDGIVVDIGGTTTDIGVLIGSFPRPAAIAVDLAGVRTNFRMPDLYSIGLGGGSLVRQNPLSIGPDSVGYRLIKEARIFGGTQLTTSDIAVAANLSTFGDPTRVADLSPAFIARAKALIETKVADAVDRMKHRQGDVPVILVGGGSVLLGDTLAGADPLIRPKHNAVANAVGAALTQVGGEVDRVVSLTPTSRSAILADIEQEARDKAITAGADPETNTIQRIETIPMAYLPDGATRIRAKAIGTLKATT